MEYENGFQWGMPEPLHPCPAHHTYQAITWHEVDDSRPDGRRLATLGCGCVVAIQIMAPGILDSEVVQKEED